MGDLLLVAVTTLFAGLAMAFGAIVARYKKLGSDFAESEFRDGVAGFGFADAVV